MYISSVMQPMWTISSESIMTRMYMARRLKLRMPNVACFKNVENSSQKKQRKRSTPRVLDVKNEMKRDSVFFVICNHKNKIFRYICSIIIIIKSKPGSIVWNKNFNAKSTHYLITRIIMVYSHFKIR